MDLEVVMNSNDCPYIVMFYGAIFKEGKFLILIWRPQFVMKILLFH